jgi:hypothetical protein
MITDSSDSPDYRGCLWRQKAFGATFILSIMITIPVINLLNTEIGLQRV